VGGKKLYDYDLRYLKKKKEKNTSSRYRLIWSAKKEELYIWKRVSVDQRSKQFQNCRKRAGDCWSQVRRQEEEQIIKKGVAERTMTSGWKETGRNTKSSKKEGPLEASGTRSRGGGARAVTIQIIRVGEGTAMGKT